MGFGEVVLNTLFVEVEHIMYASLERFPDYRKTKISPSSVVNGN